MASVIGLDIGSSAVRAVQLSSGRTPSLERLGQVLLPPNAVLDGEIAEPQLVIEAIQILMKRFGFKGRKVALGLASQQVVVRQIDLPAMPEDQLRESLPFQVQDYIPIPVDEAELDYQVLEEYSHPDGTAMLRVLLVAATSTLVNDILNVVNAAKLEPVLLDLQAFALLRALVPETGQPPAADTPGDMLVHIGATVTNIVVHNGGIPRFVRILLMGGQGITEAVQSTMNVDHVQAEALKAQPQQPGSPAAEIITERAGRIVNEIRSSLDYYRAQTGSVQVNRLILTGGGSLLPGLAGRLADSLRLPMEPAHPLQQVRVDKAGLSPEDLASAEPFIAVAVGLALGGRE